MQTKEKYLDLQVQFWAVLGPFVMLLTLLIGLLKSSPTQYPLAFVSLVGIALCWKWKVRGLAISLGILVATLAYHFSSITFDEQLWSGGVALAMALSFVITTLSFEEVSAMLHTVQIESKSRLDSIWHLDEQFREATKDYEAKQSSLQVQFEEFKQQAQQYKDRMESSEKLAVIVREELVAVHAKQEDLLQELYQTRQHNDVLQKQTVQLQRELSERSAVVENTIDEESVVLAARLQETLVVREQELMTLKSQMEYSEEERLAAQQRANFAERELQDLQAELDQRRQYLEALQEQEKLFAQQLSEEYEKELKELRAKVESLVTREKEVFGRVESFQQLAKEKDQELLLEKERLEDLKVSSSEKEMVFQNMIHEAQSQYLELQAQMESKVQTLNEQCDELQKKLEQTKSAPKKDSPAVKRIEGKYKQLLLQFEEKSEVLDEARRALFRMQEKLFNLQREMDEKHKADKNEMEVMFERQIAKFDEEHKRLEEEHQQEVDALHAVINALNVKLAVVNGANIGVI